MKKTVQQRKRREPIDWSKNVDMARAWMRECEKIGITPTTTQIQNHFNWTQTVASKVKSIISVMESKENCKNAEQQP